MIASGATPVGRLLGGDVGKDLLPIEREFASPGTDVRRLQGTFPAKNLRERGVIRAKEGREGTKRIAHVTRTAAAEFVFDSRNEVPRGHGERSYRHAKPKTIGRLRKRSGGVPQRQLSVLSSQFSVVQFSVPTRQFCTSLQGMTKYLSSRGKQGQAASRSGK